MTALHFTGLLAGALVLSASGAWARSPKSAAPADVPQMIQLDYADLVANREAAQAGFPAFVEAVVSLKAQADKILPQPLLTVTDPQKMVASSGDPHDFHTIGKSSWPNPKIADGMPWIRQDGLINPDCKTDKYDMERFGRMRGNVFTLGLAWFFTGDERYAAKAAEFLRTWYTDPETRMNPNLNYASSQPGVHEGMYIGIIFGADMIRMLDSIKLLPRSQAWTEADEKDLKQWFREFNDWLVSSPFGIAESKGKNNHGSWYAAQVATYGLYTGDTARAEAALKNAHLCFDGQISPEGAFIFEQNRNRGLSYSVYSLFSLVILANCAKYLGMDLWHYECPNKPGSPALMVAFLHMLPYVTGEQPWPKEEIGSLQGIQGQAVPLFRQAAQEYNSPEMARATEMMIKKLGWGVNLRLNNAELISADVAKTEEIPFSPPPGRARGKTLMKRCFGGSFKGVPLPTEAGERH